MSAVRAAQGHWVLRPERGQLGSGGGGGEGTQFACGAGAAGGDGFIALRMYQPQAADAARRNDLLTPPRR